MMELLKRAIDKAKKIRCRLFHETINYQAKQEEAINANMEAAKKLRKCKFCPIVIGFPPGEYAEYQLIFQTNISLRGLTDGRGNQAVTIEKR